MVETMKMRCPDGHFRHVGTQEHPVYLKQPDGSWKEYAGGSVDPLMMRDPAWDWTPVLWAGHTPVYNPQNIPLIMGNAYPYTLNAAALSSSSLTITSSEHDVEYADIEGVYSLYGETVAPDEHVIWNKYDNTFTIDVTPSALSTYGWGGTGYSARVHLYFLASKTSSPADWDAFSGTQLSISGLGSFSWTRPATEVDPDRFMCFQTSFDVTVPFTQTYTASVVGVPPTGGDLSEFYFNLYSDYSAPSYWDPDGHPETLTYIEPI